jgi:deoxyribodipyrimidine photo-lyase
MMDKSLMWFRSDLRVSENDALSIATQSGLPVIGIYLYCARQWKIHQESNIKQDFLIKNLFALERKLHDLNIPLIVIKANKFSSCANEISRFVTKHSVRKLFFNKEFGINEEKRDQEVIALLPKNTVEVKTFSDQVLFEPGSLKTQQDKPFSVFTPYKRRWIEHFDPELLNIYPPKKNKESLIISSNIESFDFEFSITHEVDINLWPAGEDEAKKRLEYYLSKRVLSYHSDRNDPILDGTSRISPYLALGVISFKYCLLEALKINDFELTSGHKGVVKWVDELIWREFYRNIMFSFPKVSMNKPFQDYTNKIEWRHSETEFNAWKSGETGIPLIDAAMKQLRFEGWMHNRLRMVVAMFFTKNLLHDWRIGEGFFMEMLIDGDFPSNNGGWQWSASTGTDAAPYFRIFNPIAQSERFDPDGDFIKKWLPQLNGLSSKEIHLPAKDFVSNVDYPNPIVDLKSSRIRAIEAFKAAKA